MTPFQTCETNLPNAKLLLHQKISTPSLAIMRLVLRPENILENNLLPWWIEGTKIQHHPRMNDPQQRLIQTTGRHGRFQLHNSTFFNINLDNLFSQNLYNFINM